MWLTTTFVPSSLGGVGKIFQSRPVVDLTQITNELPIPAGFNITNTDPCGSTYRNRYYMVNVGTENAMIDEHYRFGVCGRPAPTEVPTLAAGAAGGRTGSCVVAIAFWDEIADEWGPMSGISASVTLTNQKATTGNIPTTCSDGRMTHVGVWVSMNGAAFRLSTKRQLGVSTFSEGVATLALGMAFPTTFEKLPRGAVNAIYHERQFIAGDALNPDILYASGLLFPERWEGLSFQTRNGEPIVALIPTRAILLVLTTSSAYAVRGWTEDDMVMEMIDGDIGTFNQRCVKLVNGNPVFPNDKGMWLYNGAFHLIMRDRQAEWAAAYKANAAIYEKGFAVVDPNSYTYEFYTSGYTSTPSWVPNPDAVVTKTIAWVGYYKDAIPEISGAYGQFEWQNDVMARAVDSVGLLGLPGGKRGDVYFGFCDGILRKRDPTDNNDDGDTYGKRWWLRTSAMDMGDPGGNDDDGKTWHQLWSYMESEAQAWKLYVKGGDEQAYQAITPTNVRQWWKHEVAASAITEFDGGTGFLYDFVPKSRHPHIPARVSGHMLTLEYTVLSPLGLAWRGFGGIYGPGPGTRPAKREYVGG